ncbi:hypothetical protein [Enterococcus gilvus]|uniref:hypothetical protein n=1 Tax=Enterococcus gilvus TaxID=160453 RepID=UPI0028D2051D|nr:hypothetical protein [Enterococcus gilvus]
MKTENLMICSYTCIQNKATTIRLFDHSIWVNMNHGRFMNRRTKEERIIIKLYPMIRTAVCPGGTAFAKRKNPLEDLYIIAPFRVKHLL